MRVKIPQQALYSILVILMLMSQTFQKCGFDIEKQRRIKPAKLNIWGDQKRFLQSTTWEPIRIHVDETTLDSQVSLKGQEYIDNLKTVLNQVVSLLQILVSVKPAQELIAATASLCGDSQITAGADVQAGVATDLIVFPYIDMNASPSLEAAATYCATDSVSNRPLVGSVAFSGEMDFTKGNTIYYVTLLVLHEFNHIMSFNSDLFSLYIDGNGNTLGLDNVVFKKVVNGLERTLIKTPKVLQYARKHFGCATLDGVELENQGGAGTVGSHWETRVMAGEYMVGTSYCENVVSEMSLAQMEDSGWYKLNYYTGGLFRWGKNQGCNFLETKCVQNQQVVFPGFFTDIPYNSPACTGSRTSIGIGSLGIGYTISNSNYQYYTDPTEGGYEPADFCPMTIDLSQSDTPTKFYPGSCWIGDTHYASLGETIGDNSYCFMSSLVPISQTASDQYVAICYEIQCNPASKNYNVFINGKTITCPTAGASVTSTDFHGALICTDYNLLCTKSQTCGNVVDCIQKKVITIDALYNYSPSNDALNPADFQVITKGSRFLTFKTIIALLSIFILF